MSMIIFHPDKYPQGIFHSYKETQAAIENKADFIRTTQMSLLDINLLELGYNIIIQSDSKVTHIALQDNNTIYCDSTNRQLTMSMNLFKLWKAGEFN